MRRLRPGISREVSAPMIAFDSPLASRLDPMGACARGGARGRGRGEVPVGAVILHRRQAHRLGGQPHARAEGPDGPCGDARRFARPGASFGLRAASGLRSLRDARALRDVRHGDLLRAPAAALFRCLRSEDGRRRARRAHLRATDLPPRPEIYGGIREGEAATLLRSFFEGGERDLLAIGKAAA